MNQSNRNAMVALFLLRASPIRSQKKNESRDAYYTVIEPDRPTYRSSDRKQIEGKQPSTVYIQRWRPDTKTDGPDQCQCQTQTGTVAVLPWSR